MTPAERELLLRMAQMLRFLLLRDGDTGLARELEFLMKQVPNP